MKNVVLVMALLALGACGVLPGGSSQKVRAVGVLVDADHMPGDPLVVPDTVDVGVAFQVTVTTIAPADCWTADGADVSVTGLTAEIVPYDATSLGANCMTLTTYPVHVVTLTFDQAGLATVRAKGRQFGTGTDTPPQVIIESQVVVR